MEKRYAGVAFGIIVLGIVSLLTDISSEMILALLPLFMLETLGLSMTSIGVVEGLAEASAGILKIASGWLSDRMGKRKLLATMGYGLSALTKPFFSFATTFDHILALRVTDRIGKGIRTSPRDALIGQMATVERRGWAFGIHRGLDTAGAFIGPLLVVLLLPLFTYRQIFFLTLIPGFSAVALLILFVKEAGRPVKRKPTRIIVMRKIFGRKFTLFMIAAGIVALGNFSYAFFLLKARQLGAPELLIPAIYMLFNAVYALSAFPMGIVADRIGKSKTLTMGYAVFALTCLGAAYASTMGHVLLIMVSYGLFNAVMETTQRAIIPDFVRKDLLGTAFGFYHTSVGVAAFFASTLAGVLWTAIGSWATFYYGATLAMMGIVPLLFLIKAH